MANRQELERALRAASTAVRDELADPPGERRYDPELTDAATELRGVLGEVVRTVRTSAHRAELHALVTDALDAGQVVLLDAGDDATALQRLDLEQEVEALHVLDARLRVAEVLRAAPVRDTAERAGLAPAYISELRNVSKAKGGLPSADAAARIDQVLGLDDEHALAALVRETKAEVKRLRKQRERWLARATPVALVAYDPAVDRRVQAIAEAARRDDVVARAAELLVSISDRERRAVLRLLEELGGG